MGIQRFIQSRFGTKKHKTRTDQNSDIGLPTELWFEVLSHLPQDSIAAVSLTSRSLKMIAQPLLFEGDLLLHPFTSSITYRRLHLGAYIARCHDRLDFISSPRIACHIRYLSLTPFPVGHLLSRSAKLHIPENDIVDHFFSILLLLPSLQSLVIHSIRSTPLRMAILRSLSLEHFQLETRGDDISWYKMPQGETRPTPLPARRVVSFNCNASLHQPPVSFFVPLQFLNPLTLEEINAGRSGTESVLVAISLSISSFPRLATLDIYARFVALPSFIPALRQCPGLITLRLRSDFTDSPGRPSIQLIPLDVLPVLNTYHGPLYFAQLFASGRKIRDFKLWSSPRVSSVVKPDELAPILQQLGTHVEVLEIGVTTLPPFLISVIAENLPNLKSLAVNSHLSSYHAGLAHMTQTPFEPSIRIGEGSSQLNLDTLSFGVQIADSILVGSPEYENAGLELLKKFPVFYDPTSLDQWTIELAWSKIIWNRLNLTNRSFDAPGELNIEHVEYHSAVFCSSD